MSQRRLLAISGSLRRASTNSALLRAVRQLAPAEITVEVYGELALLPPFNPDLELPYPPAVERLRRQLNAADGVLLASPEYAHGISGVLKNSLDWLVGCEAWVGKPVALLNAAPRAHHALEALAEVLRTMSARLVVEAALAVPLLGSGLDEDGIVGHPEIAPRLRAMLLTFARAIGEGEEVAPEG